MDKKADLTTINSTENSTHKKINVFEMFAGIGSQHKALSNLRNKEVLDFEIVGTSEWFIKAILAYNKIHFKNTNIGINIYDNEFDNLINKDISFSLNSKDICSAKSLLKKNDEFKAELAKAFKQMKNFGSIKEIKGKDLANLNIDVLTYSFPCQDLSTAGFFWNKANGMGKESNTRSSLVWEIERILKELNEMDSKPKILIMENVKSILNKTHIHNFEKWIDALSKLGYKTHYKTLNGIDFGIPQKRERVIAISCLKNMKYSKEMWNKYEQEYLNKHGEKLKLNKILKKEYSNKTYFDEAFAQIPNNTPSRKKMFEKCKNLEFSTSCWTISTKQDRFPNAGIIHFNEKEKILFSAKNSNFRFLTPRECFLLMGFTNKDYEKVKKLNLTSGSEFLLAGNSIIVNVLESIFYVVNKIIKGCTYEKNWE